MTTDEWLQALRDAHKPQNADGLTSQELAQAWGVAVNTAQRRIKQLILCDRVKFNGYKSTQSITGVHIKTPCYILKGDR